jgi:hypothetical protein
MKRLHSSPSSARPDAPAPAPPPVWPAPAPPFLLLATQHPHAHAHDRGAAAMTDRPAADSKPSDQRNRHGRQATGTAEAGEGGLRPRRVNRRTNRAGQPNTPARAGQRSGLIPLRLGAAETDGPPAPHTCPCGAASSWCSWLVCTWNGESRRQVGGGAGITRPRPTATAMGGRLDVRVGVVGRRDSARVVAD